jgi:hypothetical protein
VSASVSPSKHDPKSIEFFLSLWWTKYQFKHVTGRVSRTTFVTLTFELLNNTKLI